FALQDPLRARPAERIRFLLYRKSCERVRSPRSGCRDEAGNRWLEGGHFCPDRSAACPPAPAPLHDRECGRVPRRSMRGCRYSVLSSALQSVVEWPHGFPEWPFVPQRPAVLSDLRCRATGFEEESRREL